MGLDNWREKPKEEKKMKGLNLYHNLIDVEITKLNLLLSFISLVLTPWF